jgi:hypothetical protein
VALHVEDVLEDSPWHLVVGLIILNYMCIPHACCFGYCNVIVLGIILTIEVRYTVVQHFVGLAYIVALPIID